MSEATRTYEFIEFGTFGNEACWWYRASDTGQRVGMLNPRWGLDGDEDGIWHVLEHDGRVVEDHKATDDESDEYDDLYFEVKSHLVDVSA